MTKMFRLTRAISLGVVMSAAIGLVTTAVPLEAKERPENDCLIGVKDDDGATLGATLACTDGDACDDDGATDGKCTFNLQGCVNIPGVEGCTLRPLKKAKIKTSNGKNGVRVEPVDPNAEPTSVCGAFLPFEVPLKKNGRKPGKRKIISSAVANVKPAGQNKDKDKTVVTCAVCTTEGGCVPPTTTTVTTTSTTTTTNPCGNGTVDAGETCDPDALPNNGCSGGTPFCDTTTCASCKANCTELAFKVGTPTEYCGFPGVNDPAFAPYSGRLEDGTAANIADLGVGCLYIGGGNAKIVPPGPVPDSSEIFFTVSDCSQNTPTLSASTGTSAANCSEGPAATSSCTNGHPGTNGNGACTSAADCDEICSGGMCINGAPGPFSDGTCTVDAQCGSVDVTCQPDPVCFFGAPLPIANTVTSTCVLNVIKDGVSGTADISAGTATINLPLKSWVYLTGITYDPNPSDATDIPCPICQAGVCSAGPRAGQACVTANALGTTHDCPPDPYLFLAPLDVALNPLTTNTATLTDTNGLFCPGQTTAGAFGVEATRTIVETGSPASGGFALTRKDTTLGSVFCIPLTGNGLIDPAADLPGPGATGLGGQARLR